MKHLQSLKLKILANIKGSCLSINLEYFVRDVLALGRDLLVEIPLGINISGAKIWVFNVLSGFGC
jgi:hypothetical protein